MHKGTRSPFLVLSVSFLALGFFGFCSLASFGLTKPCPTGAPVGSFKLLLLPAKGGSAIPIAEINRILPGEKLRYEPAKLPESLKEKARVSLILVPAGTDGAKQLQV